MVLPHFCVLYFIIVVKPCLYKSVAIYVHQLTQLQIDFYHTFIIANISYLLNYSFCAKLIISILFDGA